MATRATYSIETNYDTQYFYIHWDNYEAGAAHYFYNMHNAAAKRDCLAVRFIAGNNECVEFTRHHDQHSDTEYRYYLKKNGDLEVKKFFFKKETWEIIFSGHYAEFINTHLKTAYENNYNVDLHFLYPFEESQMYTDKKILKYISKKELESKLGELSIIAASYNDDNPNKKSTMYKIKEIADFLQEIRKIK